MAYFSNSTDGGCFAEQCEKCRYGQKPCPIACIQMNYNYDAVNNTVATRMLNDLVNQYGTCSMFEAFKKDFALTKGEIAQQELDY